MLIPDIPPQVPKLLPFLSTHHLQTQVVPWKLWSMVGCLVAADAVFLTIWQILDPLKKWGFVSCARYILNLTFQTNHDIWHWDIWQPGRGCGVPAPDLGLQIRLPQRVAWWAEIISQPTAANNYLHSCHTQASPTATRGCSSSWVCSWPTRPGVSRYKCEGLSEKILSICFVVSCRYIVVFVFARHI